MKNMGEKRGGSKLPDLTLWFKITLKADSNTAEFVEKLKRLNSVEKSNLVLYRYRRRSGCVPLVF